MSHELYPEGVMTFAAFAQALDRVNDARSRFENFSALIDSGFLCFARRMALKPSVGKEIEERFEAVMSRYQKAGQRQALAELFAEMSMAITGYPGSFLSMAYQEMELHKLNPSAQQFFTPYPVARSMAEVTIATAELERRVAQRRPLRMGEPACGAGTFAVAAADTIRERGFDPRSVLLADLTDKDELCMHMAYLQCWFREIPAICRHGNTLTGEVYDWVFTPVVLRQHWAAPENAPVDPSQPSPPTVPPPQEAHGGTDEAPPHGEVELPASDSRTSQFDLFNAR